MFIAKGCIIASSSISPTLKENDKAFLVCPDGRTFKGSVQNPSADVFLDTSFVWFHTFITSKGFYLHSIGLFSHVGRSGFVFQLWFSHKTNSSFSDVIKRGENKACWFKLVPIWNVWFIYFFLHKGNSKANSVVLAVQWSSLFRFQITRWMRRHQSFSFISLSIHHNVLHDLEHATFWLSSPFFPPKWSKVQEHVTQVFLVPQVCSVRLIV